MYIEDPRKYASLSLWIQEKTKFHEKHNAFNFITGFKVHEIQLILFNNTKEPRYGYQITSCIYLIFISLMS